MQRKSCSRTEVVGNKVDSEAMLRWSDDDYQSFSKYRRVDLSAEQSKLNRCGSFRRRAFELRHVADTTIQLSALELIWSVIMGIFSTMDFPNLNRATT